MIYPSFFQELYHTAKYQRLAVTIDLCYERRSSQRHALT